MIMDKKAAIGAAITWVVATIIILVVVILFIYSSYAIAKEKKILGFNPLVQEIEQSSSIDSEQNLLALMQTKINEKTIKEQILDSSYKNSEKEIRALLNKLPDYGFDGWVLVIDDYPIKSDNAGLNIFESRKSELYLGNKKIRLYLNAWE